MKLPTAAARYDATVAADTRRLIMEADDDNLKRRRDLVLANGERLIVRSADGTLYPLLITNAGQVETALGVPFGVAFSCRDISAQPLSTIIARISPGIIWTLPASIPNGHGKSAAPSANTDFDILVNGVSVGTARWATSATTPTFIKAADTVLAASAYLDIVTPANLHGMSGPLSLTLMGARF